MKVSYAWRKMQRAKKQGVSKEPTEWQDAKDKR